MLQVNMRKFTIGYMHMFTLLGPFQVLLLVSLYVVCVLDISDLISSFSEFFIFILLSRESVGAMRRTNPDSLRSCPCFRVFRLSLLLTSSICCLLDSTKQI